MSHPQDGHSHHGHSHGHGHGSSGGLEDWDEMDGARVRSVLLSIVGVLALLTLVGLAIWWPRGEAQIEEENLGFVNRVDATVAETELRPCAHDAAAECNALTLEIGEGEEKGTLVPLEFETDDQTTASKLDAGDKIVLDDAGPSLPVESRFSFADMQRSTSLWVLALLFAVAVVALGRLRGFLSLIGTIISLGVLLVYVFPALLHGIWPLGVALTGASIIAFATLFLAHGVNERTAVALLGTMGSLLLTALLAGVFAAAAELSGLASEESVVLLTFAPELDFRGLLLAAVIIGTLGVLDDVTVTQVSAVWELRNGDPQATARSLYAAGIRIGRDHIASAVNTLVLAYSAAALPLLLLFTQSGLAMGDVLATETVAVEVVQTLVGSIGLVASVPITTALAAWVATRTTRATPTDPPTRPQRGPEEPDGPDDFDTLFGGPPTRFR